MDYPDFMERFGSKTAADECIRKKTVESGLFAILGITHCNAMAAPYGQERESLGQFSLSLEKKARTRD